LKRRKTYPCRGSVDYLDLRNGKVIIVLHAFVRSAGIVLDIIWKSRRVDGKSGPRETKLRLVASGSDVNQSVGRIRGIRDLADASFAVAIKRTASRDSKNLVLLMTLHDMISLLG